MPIVLVAEELSPAGIAQLESAFDVRYADGADRSALLPALASFRPFRGFQGSTVPVPADIAAGLWERAEARLDRI